MNRRTRWFGGLVLAVGAIGLLAVPTPRVSLADDTKEPEVTTQVSTEPVLVDTEKLDIPLEFVDEAFDKYVDLKVLGKAIEAMDTAAMTDAALQLVEGERILKRPHKSVTAERIIKAILPLASKARDKASLTRLSAVAAQLTNKDLKGEIDSALQLADVPRKLAPVPSISPDEITPEALTFYHEAVATLRKLDASPDKAAAEKLEEELQTRTDLPQKLFDYLKSQVAIAKETKRDLEEPDDVLGKLAAISRAPIETYTKDVAFSNWAGNSKTTSDYFDSVKFPAGYELVDYSVAVSNSQHVKREEIFPVASFLGDPRSNAKVANNKAIGIHVRIALESGSIIDRYKGAYNARITYKIRKKTPPPVTINVSFRNDLTTTASFGLVGPEGVVTNFTLGAKKASGYTVVYSSGTTPFVRIYQGGGKFKDFTIAANGKYRIDLDPKTKLPTNYFQ